MICLPEKVLRHEDLKGAPLLILANKQVSLTILSLSYKTTVWFPHLLSSSFFLCPLRLVYLYQHSTGGVLDILVIAGSS
jgi:hypothetical protein